MRKDDCFELGYVVKPRGLDGELTVVFDADDPDRYLNIDAIFVESKDNLIPYIVEYVSPLNDKFILKLEEVDDPDSAGKLKSCKLFLPLEVLPELDDDEFFLHDLVGFSIVDEQKGALGLIENIYDINNNTLIALIHQGKEVLIPITEDIVKQVDKEKQVVHTLLPDGLLELYLEE
ncbi:ribosome maturation factor RimM [Chondrinema litorale]|uniref:ribosome maturation factor RimM n=1 Tax=Chondrinema litorale TaxID=2994555 RepID=UPI0025445004|nr:ribosome maturation factor RimM [Chondrinema litorale]UZR92366.1 ribosome maturation factor RimM [Chondrinema litorale]